ncbi:MAG: TIGR03618 family F420-dependent PPOX class oxidoreductase, partial [Chloroflexi bacterium]|nr:TIGR03618 family F420-dependent PPOX class oxidoreductase [Chloroflexota bacterium]
MLSDNDRAFLKANHQAVLTTFRKDGGAQMSIVTCGLYRDSIAFTTEAQRAKLLNLQRNPRCSLLVSKRDWWGYLVLEGQATLLSPGATDPAELRQGLRDIYTAASGKTHP